MANKTQNTTQPTLFDVPAERRETPERIVVRKEKEIIYLSNLGLVSLTDGRSEVYSDFADYIKRSNLIQ